MNIQDITPEQLKKARKKLSKQLGYKLSQEEVGKKLSLSKTTISNLETGVQTQGQAKWAYAHYLKLL